MVVSPKSRGKSLPNVRPARPRRVQTAADTIPVIGPSETPAAEKRRAHPRLARHLITLSNGHTVGVATCGRGVPLVLVHGFLAEGMLYAQTLSRLVDSGFRVIAIDTAGHGGTLGLPNGGADLEDYARLLGQTLDELGVRRAILAGHSMGGRLVTELAAQEPDRAIAVVLVDAIVGQTWDRLVQMCRVAPPVLGMVSGALAIDTVISVPVFRDPAQAAKLGRLLVPVVRSHMRAPWRMLGPGVSILRSNASSWMLGVIADQGIPLVVIHGQRDMPVPIATARDSARRGKGTLVTVKGAGHSWLLRDPRSLPAIFDLLFVTDVGRRVVARIADDLGLANPHQVAKASFKALDAAYLTPDSPLPALTPPVVHGDAKPVRGLPRYRFVIEEPQIEVLPLIDDSVHDSIVHLA